MVGTADPSATWPAAETGVDAPPQAPAIAAVPLSLKLIAVSAFLPEGLSFFVSGLRLTLTRVIMLALIPYLVIRFGRRLAAGRYRFVLADALVLAAGFWMFVAPAQIDGLAAALQHSGPIALEFCVAYLVTRIVLREPGQALAFVNLLCLVIAVVALIGLLDSLAGTYLIRDLVTSMTGYRLKAWDQPPQLRFGIVRAMGPLEHPILYALACGIGLLLAAGTDIRARWFAIGACMLGAVFSFSAGPIESAMLGLALLVYHRIFAGLEGRSFALGSLAALLCIAYFVGSSHPFGFVVEHFAFEPQASWYRIYTWHIAGSAVLQSPWFGTGFTDWGDVTHDLQISGSVDALWLEAALIFGIPGSALIGSVMLGSMLPSANGPRATLSPTESQLATTLSILMLVIVLVGFAVHLWGTDWILCGLLAGTRAHLSELGRAGFASRVQPSAAATA